MTFFSPSGRQQKLRYLIQIFFLLGQYLSEIIHSSCAFSAYFQPQRKYETFWFPHEEITPILPAYASLTPPVGEKILNTNSVSSFKIGRKQRVTSFPQFFWTFVRIHFTNYSLYQVLSKIMELLNEGWIKQKVRLGDQDGLAMKKIASVMNTSFEKAGIAVIIIATVCRIIPDSTH